MISVIHTLDYEIHGNGDGDPLELMVEPTNRLLDLFDEYGAKLTIMADVAEILKFRELRDATGQDLHSYEAIAAQLRDAIRRGHDVQLHLHCSYFNAQFENGKWQQDWSEYNFASLPFERLDQVVRLGKNFLETLLRPVNPDYNCIAFRAANWAVSPSQNVVRSLLGNGFKIETSVFKYGRREGIVSFDYSNAESNLIPWPASEEDICVRDDSSELLEIPIYCEKRWIGAFLTGLRLKRALQSRRHPIRELPVAASAKRRSPVAKAAALFSKHAWKADFNQCTGPQLIRALERASRAARGTSEIVPFVLIGHSKLFTPENARALRPFLQYVRLRTDQYCFGLFDPMLTAIPGTTVNNRDKGEAISLDS